MTDASNGQRRPRPLILLADDDPELRKMLRVHLETMDCDLLEASDGAKALETIITDKPDLVILDVMMPQLKGWEICEYVRKRPEYDNTGVLMLTGIGPTLNELTSPLYGADDFIDKPFNLAELDFKIRAILSKRRDGEAE